MRFVRLYKRCKTDNIRMVSVISFIGRCERVGMETGLRLYWPVLTVSCAWYLIAPGGCKGGSCWHLQGCAEVGGEEVSSEGIFFLGGEVSEGRGQLQTLASHFVLHLQTNKGNFQSQGTQLGEPNPQFAGSAVCWSRRRPLSS